MSNASLLSTVEVAANTLINILNVVDSKSNALDTISAACVTDKKAVCNEKVLSGLKHIILNGNTSEIAKASAIVYDLSGEQANRVLMGSSSIGLMEAMVQGMQKEKGPARSSLMNALYNLARINANESRMCSKELGLLDVIASIVRSEKGVIREEALRCLWNISITGTNKTAIARKELGLLSDMLKLIREESGEDTAKYYSLGALGNLVYSTSVCETLMAVKFHDTVLPLCGNSTDDVSKRSFRMLMMYCSYEPAARAVKLSPGSVDRMMGFTGRDSIEGLCALMIVFFLVGRDESAGSGGQLLRQRPNAIAELIRVLAYTLKGEGGKDHNFGFFNLKIILCAFKCLSLSDANKAEMCKSTQLVPTLLVILDMFINDSGRIKPVKPELGGDVGGGRDDTANVLSVTEILLQLSFNFETVSELRQKLFLDSYDLTRKLEDVIRLGSSAKMTVGDLEYTTKLLNKLSKPDPVAVVPLQSMPAAPTAPSGGGKHVFVSYAWKANKPLVVRMCKELRSLGVEVWRDEDGSKYVPAMSGNTDDIMAEAIEKSSYAIVCVSRDYKESPNCRMEGKYINDLSKRHKLKMIYVMMDENYHMTSSPEYVDGWLAFMIGDSHWHSMWSDSQVSSTVAAIRPLLDATVSNGSPVSSSVREVEPLQTVFTAANATSAQIAPAATGGPLEEAWKLLSNNTCAISPDDLAAKLDELGVSEEEDLNYLALEDLELLGNLLKPAKKGRFMSFISKTK